MYVGYVLRRTSPPITEVVQLFQEFPWMKRQLESSKWPLELCTGCAVQKGNNQPQEIDMTNINNQ